MVDDRYRHPPQFAGRYAGCVLDDAGNCSRWNHDHPPAEPSDDRLRESVGRIEDASAVTPRYTSDDTALEMSRRVEQSERKREVGK